MIVYATPDGYEIERVYVAYGTDAPKRIDNRDGTKPMFHGIVAIADVHMPDHQPKVGDRVLIPISMETATIQANGYVSQFWQILRQNPELPRGKKAVQLHLRDEFYGNGRNPMLVVVSRELVAAQGWDTVLDTADA